RGVRNGGQTLGYRHASARFMIRRNINPRHASPSPIAASHFTKSRPSLQQCLTVSAIGSHHLSRNTKFSPCPTNPHVSWSLQPDRRTRNRATRTGKDRGHG